MLQDVRMWRLLPVGCFAVGGLGVGWAGQRCVELTQEHRLGAWDRDAAWLASPLIGFLWIVAMAWLARGLARRAPVGERESIWLRIGIACLVGGVAAALPHKSWQLSHWQARTRLLAFGWVLFWSGGAVAVLRRRQITALVRASAGRTLGSLGLLLAMSGGLVLFAESLIDWWMLWTMDYVPDHDSLGRQLIGFLLNSLILVCILGVVFALTDRLRLTVLVVGGGYIALVLANCVKLSYMLTPVRVHDIDLLHEAATVVEGLVGRTSVVVVLVICGLLGSVVLWLLLRRGPRSTRKRARLVIGVVCAGVLISMPRWVVHPGEGGERLLGGYQLNEFEPRQHSLQNGLLLFLLLDLRVAEFAEPDGYSQAKVMEIASAAPPQRSIGQRPPDLVIVMVESLMDPRDLGCRYSEDPIPFLRSLQSEHSTGHAVSPVFGGSSANAEFELLTGFPVALLPGGVLAYNHYVTRDLPALPRFLGERGYRTVSVVVAPKSFFNRAEVYPHLGFQHSVWLNEVRPILPRDFTGLHVRDDVMVDRVLEELRTDAPSFLFAFNNATHAGYDRARYPESSLDVLEHVGTRAARELGGYINALRILDLAIARLVRGLRASGKPTVLMVVGDHLPPFAGPDGVYTMWGFWPQEQIAGVRRRHTVPVFIWSSVRATRREFLCSMNFLALDALEVMGIDPGGFFGLLRGYRDELPVLSRIVVDKAGNVRSIGPGSLRRGPVQSLQLLQYDLLVGSGFAARRLMR